ncbi:MAG: hypothetical protein KC583_10105 [Myxococcales bacterium]|nr:hypothetical protein [Myxococcales bacterium]
MRGRTLLWALGALLALGSPVVLAGCGGDAETGSRQRGAGTAARKRKPAAAAAAVSMDKVPEKLKNVEWDTTADLTAALREERDPFQPYVDDLVKKPEAAEDAELQRKTGSIIDSEVPELQLIAIITGTAVSKAMVTDSQNLGHLVRVGDVVGQKVPMRVVRITRNEVLFRPLQATVDDQPVEDVRKVLLTQEELEELRP